MENIEELFRGYPSQAKVASEMLRCGICAKEGKAYCGRIEIADVALARACDVDRRVVRSTLERISSTPELDAVFSKIMPMLSMVNLAPEIGCSSIVIVPTDARLPGILANVTTVLYNSGISLRQAVVDDSGDREKSVLEIVVDGKLPENIIMLLKNCRGVDSIIIK